jgi:hypothetical protein
MKNHTFTVRPHPLRRGHTIAIHPPLQTVRRGEDVEGIGWVPRWGGPALEPIKHVGWYKYRRDALQRAATYTHGATPFGCQCRLCDPTNAIHQRNHAAELVQAICGKS